MPPRAVYVGRPTKWGNPYRIGVDGDAGRCVDKFRSLTRTFGEPFVEEAITALRGKDLACFCPLDRPCHADVLLELANA